jgi:hypothetical protein
LVLLVSFLSAVFTDEAAVVAAAANECGSLKACGACDTGDDTDDAF